MNKSLYSLLVAILLFMTSCGVIHNSTENSEATVNSISQDHIELKTSMPVLDSIQAENYLRQEVTELEDYDRYISEKSNGKAHLIVERSGDLKDDFKNGESLGKYYMVYVGEQWEDHKVNWDWFYVSKEFDEVLWYYIPDSEVYSLSEWRNSSYYRQLDK